MTLPQITTYITQHILVSYFIDERRNGQQKKTTNREPTKWNILSGNEIALLLADWVWGNYVRTNPTADKSMIYFLLKSINLL
jgi:hypothetical protein